MAPEPIRYSVKVVDSEAWESTVAERDTLRVEVKRLRAELKAAVETAAAGLRDGAEPSGSTELIVNGEFEAGDMGWEVYSELGRQVIVLLPQEPSMTAMAAVLGNGSQDDIAQDVLIPQAAKGAQLTFRLMRLYLARPGPCVLAAVIMPISNGIPQVVLTEQALSMADGWHLYGPIDLSAHAGTTVRLLFLALDGCVGGFALDDVSIRATDF